MDDIIVGDSKREAAIPDAQPPPVYMLPPQPQLLFVLPPQIEASAQTTRRKLRLPIWTMALIASVAGLMFCVVFFSVLGYMAPPKSIAGSAGLSPSRPVSNVPKDGEGYARYLKEKYSKIGGVVMSFSVTTGSETSLGDGSTVHTSMLDVDGETNSSLAATIKKTDEQAWGDAVMADAKANWPGEKFQIYLLNVDYVYGWCRGCNTECYQRETVLTPDFGYFETTMYVGVSNVVSEHTKLCATR